MASRVATLVRAAGVGSRPGDEQDTAAGYRSERLRPAGRRLHQSDLAALGGGSREEEGRHLAGRLGLSEPGQPVLARTRAVPLQAYGHADAPAAGRDPDAVQRG